MTKFEKLLYLPLELSLPSDINVGHLDGIDYSDMYCDEYRNCYHINLFTSRMEPTKFMNLFPQLSKWLHQVVFPIFLGRVMIIVTPPYQKNNLHIDCSPDKFNTLQHKFRFVIQGQVDSLCFSFRNKTTVSPNNINMPFIMDGKWPHYMVNSCPYRKYTLAIGWPWEPDLQNESYINLLEKSFKIHEENGLFIRENDELPDNWQTLFEKKYLGGKVPSWHKDI